VQTNLKYFKKNNLSYKFLLKLFSYFTFNNILQLKYKIYHGHQYKKMKKKIKKEIKKVETKRIQNKVRDSERV